MDAKIKKLLAAIGDIGTQDVYTDAEEHRGRTGSMRNLCLVAHRVSQGIDIPDSVINTAIAAAKDDSDTEPEPQPQYKCPKCGDTEHIDIAAQVWVRLNQSDDGSEIFTDADESHDGSHEWNEHSGALCESCSHHANLSEFENPEFKKSEEGGQ